MFNFVRKSTIVPYSLFVSHLNSSIRVSVKVLSSMSESKKTVLVYGKPPLNLPIETLFPSLHFETCYSQNDLKESLLKHNPDAVATFGFLPFKGNVLEEVYEELQTEKKEPNIKKGQRRLTVVSNNGVGYDNLDVDTLTKLGVWATNAPDVVTDATSDTALLLTLSCLRLATHAEMNAREGKWRNGLPLGNDLTGKTLGVIGFGRIGKDVVRKFQPWNLKVLYHNRNRASEEDEKTYNAEYATLDRLLAESDVISLNTPLTSSTRDLINEEQFKKMKDGFVLVNTARGPVINEAAMLKALRGEIEKEGGGKLRVGAIGLDVHANEPHISPDFFPFKNVTIYPHFGTYTHETCEKLIKLTLSNIENTFSQGKPLTPVNEPQFVISFQKKKIE